MTSVSHNGPRPSRNRRPDLVSVVIPARNAVRTLEAQLEALRAQDYDGKWEVVVVDNGSTDGTAALARGWDAAVPLRVVYASAARGASFARNQGWRSAGGDLVAFCDADDVVSPAWLSQLAATAQQADVVGGRYDFERLNVVGGRGWWTGDQLPIAHQFLPFAPGGTLAVWVDVLETLGGFNETYPNEQDVEFCWRAQLASMRLVYAPDALVHCRFRTGLDELAIQTFRGGQARAHLYRDFRRAGMPRSKVLTFVGDVGLLLLSAPIAPVSTERRRGFVWRASNLLGRLVGSVRYRVLYL
jgi:glycosyltransferase involved in cell wall biosynthesis